jgi:branched-subunit amino acid permease
MKKNLSLRETVVITSMLFLDKIVNTVSKFLPPFRYSLGWIYPAIVGFVIGLGLEHTKKSRPTHA